MLHDLFLAARSLRRSPGFTIAALLTLTLGIGMTTGVFSVVYGVVFRPLPFPNADRVVAVTQLSPSSNPADPYRTGLSPEQVKTWRDRSKTTSQIGFYDSTSLTLTGRSAPVRLVGAEVSAGVFAALGTPPLKGRIFVHEDEERGADPVVILSYGTWVSRTGADADIVGRSLTLDNRPHRVVGVMPQGFGFPSVAGASAPLNSEGRPADVPELWVPIPPKNPDGGTQFREAIALLKPGVTIAQAVAEGSLILQPSTSVGQPPPAGFRFVELVPLGESAGSESRPILLTFQAGVTLVLLIACVNVINLLLARAASRSAELSVRAALGATRGQLIRYAIAEALLLALTGGALGSALAYAMVLAVRQLPPHVLPRLAEIRFDGSVLAFACVLSTAAGLAVGVMAALRSLRVDVWQSVHTAGSRGAGATAGRQRPSRALVVGEITLAMVLLSGAGLLLNSFVRLLDVQPGINPDRLLMLRVTLPEAGYRNPAMQAAFSTTFAETVRSLPGVASVGMAADGYVIGSSTGSSLQSVDGVAIGRLDLSKPGWEKDLERSMAWFRRVGPGFIATLGIQLRSGRDFTLADLRPRSATAIVSETFARIHFGDRNPVGRYIGFGGNHQIIGVVGDVRSHPRAKPAGEIYLPIDESDDGPASTSLVVVVRAAGDPLALVSALRRALTRLDPQLAAYDVMTMDQFLARSFVSPRFYGLVSTIFAVMAVLLAAIGLYGVLAYSVASRRQELGVRLAIGADARTLLAGVMRQGLALTVAGIVSGAVGAYYASRYLEAQLFGVTPHDPTTFAAVAMLFLMVGAVACYVPARRAMRVDPVVALRCE